MKPTILGLNVLGPLMPFQLQELARRVNNEVIYKLWAEDKDIEQISKLLGIEEIYNQYIQNAEILIEKRQNQKIVQVVAQYRLYLLEQMCLPDRSKNQ